MILIAQQCAFVVKVYYQTGSIKKVQNEFRTELVDSRVPTKKSVLNLIKKFETQYTVADLPHAGRPIIRIL